MARSNVANHSLRLNLDNEQHRRVEKVLAGLNLDVHKSINQFLVEAADAYISRLEGSDLTYEDVPKKEEVRYITRDDLEELRREIKDAWLARARADTLNTPGSCSPAIL